MSSNAAESGPYKGSKPRNRKKKTDTKGSEIPEPPKKRRGTSGRKSISENTKSEKPSDQQKTLDGNGTTLLPPPEDNLNPFPLSQANKLIPTFGKRRRDSGSCKVLLEKVVVPTNARKGDDPEEQPKDSGKSEKTDNEIQSDGSGLEKIESHKDDDELKYPDLKGAGDHADGAENEIMNDKNKEPIEEMNIDINECGENQVDVEKDKEIAENDTQAVKTQVVNNKDEEVDNMEADKTEQNGEEEAERSICRLDGIDTNKLSNQDSERQQIYETSGDKNEIVPPAVEMDVTFTKAKESNASKDIWETEKTNLHITQSNEETKETESKTDCCQIKKITNENNQKDLVLESSTEQGKATTNNVLSSTKHQSADDIIAETISEMDTPDKVGPMSADFELTDSQLQQLEDDMTLDPTQTDPLSKPQSTQGEPRQFLAAPLPTRPPPSVRTKKLPDGNKKVKHVIHELIALNNILLKTKRDMETYRRMRRQQQPTAPQQQPSHSHYRMY